MLYIAPPDADDVSLAKLQPQPRSLSIESHTSKFFARNSRAEFVMSLSLSLSLSVRGDRSITYTRRNQILAQPSDTTGYVSWKLSAPILKPRRRRRHWFRNKAEKYVDSLPNYVEFAVATFNPVLRFCSRQLLSLSRQISRPDFASESLARLYKC